MYVSYKIYYYTILYTHRYYQSKGQKIGRSWAPAAGISSAVASNHPSQEALETRLRQKQRLLKSMKILSCCLLVTSRARFDTFRSGHQSQVVRRMWYVTCLWWAWLRNEGETLVDDHVDLSLIRLVETRQSDISDSIPGQFSEISLGLLHSWLDIFAINNLSNIL